VLIELGVRIGLPGLVNDDGSAKYRDYADYIVRHERAPGVGLLAGWRGEHGETHGKGAPNPDQLQRYIDNGGFFETHVPDNARYMKPWNSAYQDWAVTMGFYDAPQPYLFSLYVEPLQKFRRAALGHGPIQPPDHLRAQVAENMDPLPFWSDPAPANLAADYPITALTQRPMAMYHSWGSQNAWLRQLHGHNPLYLPTRLMQANGLTDGDWARVTSPHGSITVPVMEMAALNDTTVWTWNAIGKRKGAWALDIDAPEATRGFLLNHLIHELLPPRGDGLRWANSDPITGQAAWFDLKVRLEKAAAPAETLPALPPIGSPVPKGPANLAWKVRQ